VLLREDQRGGPDSGWLEVLEPQRLRTDSPTNFVNSARGEDPAAGRFSVVGWEYFRTIMPQVGGIKRAAWGHAMGELFPHLKVHGSLRGVSPG